MSLVQNPFSRRGYLLSVSDIEVSATSTALRLTSLGSHGKRVMAGLLASAFVLFSVGSGFLMATSAAPKASADPFSDIFCKSLDSYNDVFSDDGLTYYGDANGASNDNNDAQLLGDSLLTGRAGGDGSLPVQQPGKKEVGAKLQTAYEKYTPFLPEFDFWYGAYVPSDATDDRIHFVYKVTKDESVTGGEKTLTGASSEDPVPSGKGIGTSNLFFHDTGSCIGGKFGGTAAVLGVNTLFAIPQTLTFFSAEIYGWAYQNSAISDEDNPLHGLLYGTKDKPNSGLNALITGYPGHKGLKDVLYLPFLIPIIMLSALSLAWTGLVKRQSIAAAQAALWMLVASITGLLLLIHPTWVPGAADYVVSKVDDATMSAMNSDSQVSSYCQLDGVDRTKPSIIARELKCTMWYNTVYVPWVSGQFGSDATPTNTSVLVQKAGMNQNILDAVKIKLGDKTLQNTKGANRWVVNWASFQLENQSMVDQVDDATKAQHGQERASAVAWAQLSGGGTATINKTWGGDAIRQGNAAILAAFASLGSLLLVLTSAFLLIAYQISVIFLIVLSPFFFLIGAVPGFGRRVMIRWFELILATVVKRVVLTLLISVFLRLYSMVMGLDINWWLQIVLISIIAIVALIQRGKIVDLFVDALDFGGDKRIGDGTDAVRGVGGKLLGAAVGAGLGALGARAGLGGKIVGAYAGGGGAGDGGTGLTSERRSDGVVAAADAAGEMGTETITDGNETRRRDRDELPKTTAEQLRDRAKTLGNAPKESDYVRAGASEDETIEQEAQYRAAMADYDQRTRDYDAENEVTNVSRRDQKKAQAARDAIRREERQQERAAAQELDPIVAAQRKANRKAIRENMFTGALNGYDNAIKFDSRGRPQLNLRGMGRTYSLAKKDAKATELNALLALDQAAERSRGIDTHNLLSRQIQLQEQMLGGGTVPALPALPPFNGGGDGGDPPSGGTPVVPTLPSAPYGPMDQNGATAGVAGVPEGIEEGAVIVDRPQYVDQSAPVPTGDPIITGGSAPVAAGGGAGLLVAPQIRALPVAPTAVAPTVRPPVSATAQPRLSSKAKLNANDGSVEAPPKRPTAAPVQPTQRTTAASEQAYQQRGQEALARAEREVEIARAADARNRETAPKYDATQPLFSPLPAPAQNPMPTNGSTPTPRIDAAGIGSVFGGGGNNSVPISVSPAQAPAPMTPAVREATVQARVEAIQSEKQQAAARTAERRAYQQQQAEQQGVQREASRQAIAAQAAQVDENRQRAARAESIAKNLPRGQVFEGQTADQWAKNAKRERQAANTNEVERQGMIKQFNETHKGEERIAQSKLGTTPFPLSGKLDEDNRMTPAKVTDTIRQGQQIVKGRVESVRDTRDAIVGKAADTKTRVQGKIQDTLKTERVAGVRDAAADAKETAADLKDRLRRKG